MNDTTILTSLALGALSFLGAEVYFLISNRKGMNKAIKTALDGMNAARDDYAHKVGIIQEDKLYSTKMRDDLLKEDTKLLGEVQTLTSQVLALQADGENYTQIIHDLRQEANSVDNEVMGLQEKIGVLENALAEARQLAQEVAAEYVAPDTSELNEAVDEVLKAIGTPKTPYEAGIYNGVVSVARVAFDSTKYEFTPRIAEAAKEKHAVRGAKGRFVSRNA